MKTYEIKMKSFEGSPLVYGKYVDEPFLEREKHDAYEQRTWKHKQHLNDNDENIIPALALKNSLSNAAKYLSMKVEGNGKATYTKHFEAAIVVRHNIVLRNATEMKPLKLHVPSDGTRGGGKRVMKTFPMIEKWEGTAIVDVYDEIITKDILEQHLKVTGALIGVMSFRPRNNGDKGRFTIVSVREINETKNAA